MSIQEVSAEQLAELFHHYHQALSPDVHLVSKANCEQWQQIPQQERKRMITVARLVLLELSTVEAERETSRQYFAKPGEAEWGA